MFDSKEFQLWLRRTLGQADAREAELARGTIPARDVRIEVKLGGRWTEVREGDLGA
jgi:hypothetical protein